MVEERLLRRQLSAEFKAWVAIDEASGRCGPGAAKARRDAHGARRGAVPRRMLETQCGAPEIYRRVRLQALC